MVAPPISQHLGPLADGYPFPFSQKTSHLKGGVHKSASLSCVLILVTIFILKKDSGVYKKNMLHTCIQLMALVLFCIGGIVVVGVTVSIFKYMNVWRYISLL